MAISNAGTNDNNSEGRGVTPRKEEREDLGYTPFCPHTLFYCGRSQVLGARVTAIIRFVVF